MKFVIDLDECKKQKLSLSTLLYLASIYFGEPYTYDSFNEACSNGCIKYSGFTTLSEPTDVELTQEGIDIIESVFLNSELTDPKSKVDRYEELAKKLQELFPKGKKDGTSYMWRDSTHVVAKKLKTLVKKFDCEFTDEQAIEATKNYIASFNGDYRYMQILRYFILKRDDSKGEENSQLLSYIQNANQEDLNDEWTATLR